MTISHSDNLYTEPAMALSYKEWLIIYEYLKHEYIPYENMEMLNLMRVIRQFLKEHESE